MSDSSCANVPLQPASGSHGRRVGRGSVLGSVLLISVIPLLTGCSGDLSHRSVAEFEDRVELPAGIERVRFEVDNGTVELHVTDEPAILVGGGARRAANTPEQLQAIEAIELAVAAVPDPEDPSTLVVRSPQLSAGQPGLLALRVGFRLPAELPVTIEIAQNGHVTAKDRRGPLTVRTGRGDLHFETCVGRIEAATGRGNTIAYEHRGDLVLRADVGDMQVFVREPDQEVRLETGVGTIQCYVPPTASFRLDARAQIGKCHSAFGFPVENPAKYSAVMIGARGDATTRIMLRTGKGHLSLGSKAFE